MQKELWIKYLKATIELEEVRIDNLKTIIKIINKIKKQYD